MSEEKRAFLESVAANEPFEVPSFYPPGEDETWLGVMSPFRPSFEPVSWGEERYRQEATHSIPKMMPSLLDALKGVHKAYWETPQGRETADRLDFLGRAARVAGQTTPGRALSDFATRALDAFAGHESKYMFPFTVGAQASRGDTSALSGFLSGEGYEFDLGDVTGNKVVDFLLSMGADPLNLIPGGGLAFISPRLISRLGLGSGSREVSEFVARNIGRNVDEVFAEGVDSIASALGGGSFMGRTSSGQPSVGAWSGGFADRLKISLGRVRDGVWSVDTLLSHGGVGNRGFVDAVNRLTRLADELGVVLTTLPSAFDHMRLSTPQLRELYSKMGFVLNDFGSSRMTRNPLPLDDAGRVAAAEARKLDSDFSFMVSSMEDSKFSSSLAKELDSMFPRKTFGERVQIGLEPRVAPDNSRISPYNYDMTRQWLRDSLPYLRQHMQGGLFDTAGSRAFWSRQFEMLEKDAPGVYNSREFWDLIENHLQRVTPNAMFPMRRPVGR